MVPRRAVGVIGYEWLLGKDVQPREQSKSLVEVEVIDVTSAFLVQELQGQEREKRARRRDHSWARIIGIGDKLLEAEPSQQGQEQEDASDASTPPAAGFQVQLATIGDFGEFRTALVFTRFPARRATGAVANEKGGGLPARQPLRNREMSEQRAAGRYPKRSATWSRGMPSTKIARRAS